MSEAALRDAAVLAIEEINERGGLLGRLVEPVVEDASSNANRFQVKAAKLLRDDKVCSIFGCWTSASRKAVLPVLENHNGLLWYPLQYEGNECSRRVVYTGSTPNQQIIPAVEWLFANGKRRFYLVGSDYIFPKVANLIVKRHLQGLGGSIVGEDYVALGSRTFESVMGKIRAQKPDVIFSTINGDSNRAFYRWFHKVGFQAREIPIMAMSLAEAEVRTIGTSLTAGHLAAWAYFESVDSPENAAFVRRFKQRYGELRVTADPIEAAYFQVHLWAQTVRNAGSTDVETIRQKVPGQKFAAPEGPISVDVENHHTWKMFRVGEIQEDGQFKIVHASPGPIRPDPWNPEINDGRTCDWKQGKTR